jgi:hypothetical protein
VLARNEGFPGIFVEDGENGYLHDGTAVDIRSVVGRFEPKKPDEVTSAVGQFSIETFRNQLVSTIESQYGKFQRTAALSF